MTILKKVLKKKPNALLVFIGSGDTELMVKQLAVENKVEDHIVFLGTRDDVNNFYSAFDCFVLPSRFEGLGIVAVEAQVNGVPSVLSDEIPDIVKINNNVVFVPLNKREVWIEEICISKLREDGIVRAREAGYDILSAAEKLEEEYMDMVKNVDEGNRNVSEE